MWIFAVVVGAWIGGLAYTLVTETSRPTNAYKPPSPTIPISKAKTKKKLTAENEKLIGLDDASYRYTSDLGANTGFTIAKFDTTTHGDRAIIQLQNASGASRVLGDNAIYGKPVIQIAGKGGFLWEYSDWDDIDINGERFTEVSNNFIISAAQCESIGDYVWKKLARHKAYSFMVSGAHPEIEPGSVWDLTINYTLNGSLVESIDTEIEVQSVTVDRNCKKIGMTSITGVIYDGMWTKSNSYRARIVGAGKPQWMQSRSNTLILASKDYSLGDADYYCTGINDQNIINTAIDRMVKSGGGSIILTSGVFNCTAQIDIIGDNITFKGSGGGTKILYNGDVAVLLYISGDNIYLSNMVLDGDDVSVPESTSVRGVYIANTSSNAAKIENITIQNITAGSVAGTASGIYASASSENDDIISCIVKNITSLSSDPAVGIYAASRCYGCTVDNIMSASGLALGIAAANRCMLNRVGTLSGSSTYKYGTTGDTQSYADSGTSYPCNDTDAGGFNS